MRHNRDRLYLLHIHECLNRVTEYTASGWEQFEVSEMAQDAVLRNLQIMGESTQHLSDSLKAGWPEVNWKEIAAFRNRLVHDYLTVNLTKIWQIVANDIPLFKDQIDAIIQSMNLI